MQYHDRISKMQVSVKNLVKLARLSISHVIFLAHEDTSLSLNAIEKYVHQLLETGIIQEVNGICVMNKVKICELGLARSWGIDEED